MKINTTKSELRIDSQGMSLGDGRAIGYARKLRSELFESNAEFAQYFGLTLDGPAMVCLDDFS